MDNKNINIVVHELKEINQRVYCVCTESKKPGQPRRERARFWNFTDSEREKYFLMKRIKGVDSVVTRTDGTPEERTFEQGEYSEDELKQKAENYARTMRENPANYLL